MRMCSLTKRYVLLRHAVDGRLRAGPNPNLVNGLRSCNIRVCNIRHDDLRRLQRTMQELLRGRNASERSFLILWRGR